jgi:hypothetical protein
MIQQNPGPSYSIDAEPVVEDEEAAENPGPSYSIDAEPVVEDEEAAEALTPDEVRAAREQGDEPDRA